MESNSIGISIPKSRIIIYVLAILTSILISIIIILVINILHPPSENENNWSFILSTMQNTIFLIISIGLSSLTVTGIMVDRYLYVKKPSKGKELPLDELQDSLLENIAFFDGRRCYDHTVRANLKKYKGKYFRCCTTHTYTKTISANDGNKLKFCINRMWKKEHFGRNNNDNKSHFEYERSMDFDERKCHDILENWNSDDIYNVIELSVKKDGREPERIDITKKHGEKAHDEQYFVFEATLPSWATGKITLKYTVQSIVEKNSYVYFDIEIPTNGFTMEFDYSEVQKLVDISCVDSVSSSKGSFILDSDTGKFDRERQGWILPKSGFVVIWTEKNKDSTPNRRTGKKRLEKK